jgi:hypothetical protein
MAVSHELTMEYSWVGAADLHRGDTNYKNINEQQSVLNYVLAPQVSRDWLLRFGAQWESYYFGGTGTAPLPDVLQQLNAVIGCDYQFWDQWIVRLELRPGIYCTSFRDIDDNVFDMPVVLGGTYLSSPDVQWVFGVLVDWRSQFPVLPAPGVRWQFADRWTLYGIFPKPRIQYQLTDEVDLYVGLGFAVGTYTVPKNFGTQHGIVKLNGATVDYFEYRTGAGASWKPRPNISIEAEVGALLGRWISYVDKDVILRSQPAPYVQVACRANF